MPYSRRVGCLGGEVDLWAPEDSSLRRHPASYSSTASPDAPVTQLRDALYQAALVSGNDVIHYEELASTVANALALEPADHTGQSDLPPALACAAAKILRDVIAFRLYPTRPRAHRAGRPW